MSDLTQAIETFFNNIDKGVRELRDREDMIRSWAMDAALKSADRIGTWKAPDIINAAKAYETYFRGDTK